MFFHGGWSEQRTKIEGTLSARTSRSLARSTCFEPATAANWYSAGEEYQSLTGLSGAATAAATAKLRSEKQLGVFTLRTKTAELETPGQYEPA